MTLMPTRLWKQMTAEQRRRAAAALWESDEAASEQKQAALLIAKQMKFRPKTVSGLDDDRKARYLASVPDLPEELVIRMLVLYHLAAQRPMMSAFLDALGIGHEHGLIGDDAVTPVRRKSLQLSRAAAVRPPIPAPITAMVSGVLVIDPAVGAFRRSPCGNNRPRPPMGSVISSRRRAAQSSA